MESLRRVVEKSASEDQDDKSGQQSEVYRKFQALSQMLSDPELDIVRKTGGTLHKGGDQVSNVAIQDRSSIAHSTTRVILEDLGEVYDQTEMQLGDKVDPTLSIMASLKLQQPSGIAGNLAGVYKYVSERSALRVFRTDFLLPPVCSTSPSSISTHPLCFPNNACAWNLTIPLPRSHRRQYPDARRPRYRVTTRRGSHRSREVAA